MEYLLGIDGGGTRTTVWLADDRMSILSRVQAGPSNPVKLGIPAAQRELAKACHRAFREAHAQPRKLQAVCAGLAGGGGDLIQRRMLAWLRKEFPARAHMVTTDAAITLAAALGERDGAIVIAGTGSIAYGRDEHGRTFQVGGWGSLFDDAGSGYDIGRRAIAAALQAHDGRGCATSLAESICRELRLRKITDVVAKSLTAQEISALFPLVQREARAGDNVARSLCLEASADLAELALTMIRHLGRQQQRVRVVCSGGLFQSSSMIRRAFARKVHESAALAQISLLRQEPVQGALLLARQIARPRTSRRRRASQESS